jgi:hypothetical protein
MLLSLLLTKDRLLDLIVLLIVVPLFGVYKKQIQDGIGNVFGFFFKSLGRGLDWLVNRFLLHDVVVRLTDDQLEKIRRADAGRLRSWLLHLSIEYRADRATVVEYSKTDAGWLASCLAESVQFEMCSIADDLQDMPVDEAIVSEIERINALEGRYHYVRDARLLDIVAMRDALLSTDVRTAFYQSLPNEKGKPWAMLALSWKTDHPLTPAEIRVLHLSGMACAFVLQSMQQEWRKKKKS